MAGLPKLPGFNFQDPTISKFHLSQTFNICNGYKQPKTNYPGIGGRELDSESVKFINISDPVRFDSTLIYGRTKSKACSAFVPHFALYDQKCLTFKAFFKQSVTESPNEFYRVRHVNILYFLDDDTITVIEPKVTNSGLNQGKLVRRSKIPKYENDNSFWHWKDFAVGKDLTFFGVVYHTVDCDLFTREYMASQGLKMGEPEEMPYDPYILNRSSQNRPQIKKTPAADDKLRRFLEYDGKVLKFKAVWDDRENEYGELMKFEILYFLADDTVLVKNVVENNSGRDPYPILLRKIKLPKIYNDTPVTYPSIYLEKSDKEVVEYYSPQDFLIGNTIFVLGRDFLLYDCDKFTRDYFKNALCIDQKPALDITEPSKPRPINQIPPHNGIGSLEDSLQNTLTFMPKVPKKDVVKQIVNANKYLRYEMAMDAVHPEDTIRKFIMFYSLSDGTIKIQEPPIRNSGILGGKYLRSSLLAKPGSDPLNPDLYTPADFYIGAAVIVYGTKFIITGADLFVYRYMMENSSKFPCEVIDSIRNYMFNKGYLKDDIKDIARENLEADRKYEVCDDALVKKSDYEKCLDHLNLTNTTDLKQEQAKYETIKHTSNVPPYGIQSVNDECNIPVHVGPQEDATCKDNETGLYTSYTPEHVDTPDEKIQKYYKKVLQTHKKICDGSYPIECSSPPVEKSHVPSNEQTKKIMVASPEVPPDACQRKTVKFANDSEKCGIDSTDLCNIKKEKTHCECTDYQPECS